MIEENGITVDRQFWLVCRLVNRAVLEGVRRDRERCLGNMAEQSFDRMFRGSFDLSAPPEPACRADPLSITDLLDAWAREAKPAEKTRYSWARILKKLTHHLGHDDAEKVTKLNIVSWKHALLTAGLSPKTVQNHLVTVGTIFSWAVRNEPYGQTQRRA